MSMPVRVPSDGTVPATDRVLKHPNGWLWLVILGIGFTTWAAFLYIGIRARRRSWLVWAAVYGALLVLSGILDTSSAQPGPAVSGVGALALLAAWLGGTAHAAAIRKDAARPRLSGGASLEAARQRIGRRAEGRRLAAKDPVLARELGVGRPDIPGSDDFGLVDVNHAPQAALCQLPGITAEFAQRIVDLRQSAGYFQSGEDLGVTLDLAPNLIDGLQEYAIFL